MAQGRGGSMLLAVAAVALAAACTPQPESNAKAEIAVLLDWQPAPSFVGFYVAQERGFYDSAGIRPRFSHGNGANEAAAQVASGRFLIGTSSAQATLLTAERGGPLTSVAVLYPKVPTVLLSRRERPILSARGVNGKRIGVNPLSATHNDYLWLLGHSDVDRQSIREVGVGFDPTPLLTGEIDGFLTYAEQVPAIVAANKDSLVVLHLSDLGLHAYGFNIIANRDSLPVHRDAIRRFVRASLEGWGYARSHPEEAIRAYLRAVPQSDSAVARASVLAVLASLTSAQVDAIGAQSDSGWQNTIGALQRAGVELRRLNASRIWVSP